MLARQDLALSYPVACFAAAPGVEKPAKAGGDDKHAHTPSVKADRTLVDFCHVLLNSNGFLYVD